MFCLFVQRLFVCLSFAEGSSSLQLDNGMAGILMVENKEENDGNAALTKLRESTVPIIVQKFDNSAERDASNGGELDRRLPVFVCVRI